ncbi:MAG: hypothetical protein GX596_05885 [Propionibacterium sp.]|nr:hypothetical protein [Propionibacterium sp.]
MALIQLAGGTVRAPDGALNIRLSQATGLELVLVGPDGAELAPNFQVTRTEVVVVPTGPITVTARSTTGGPFPSGARLGVTLKSAAGTGDEVVRPAADVGGRQAVSLVEIVGGEIADLMGQTSTVELAWMQRGNYAFHVNHKQSSGRTTRWACVLDGSATAHHAVGPDAYQQLIELVLGVASTAYGGPPEQWLVATSPPTEITATLDGEQIDWERALAHPPAPWPSLQESVRDVGRRLPEGSAVVLIDDGVPVDYREVLEIVRERELECIVVALGRSERGARPEDRAAQFWDEEFAALEGFDRVVGIATLAGLAEGASRIADAMFPGGSQ